MKSRGPFFITGFPGFIATKLLGKLAERGGEFVLLVEPRFVKSATAIAEGLAKASPASRFQIIEGDITQADLGIDKAKADRLRKTVRTVYHLAAIYDLEVRREVAMRINAEGTKNIGDFVARLEHLDRYNYVSTCYVAGLRQGRILETELEHSAGFRNFYEESKYLAEVAVEKLKPFLPVTIFRPSVVVGDSQSGETSKYDGIYYLIKYLVRAPHLLRIFNVGNHKVRLNLVPVDFVVNAMAALDADPLATGKTIALADPNPLTTAELFDVIAENLSGKRSLFTPPAELIKFTLSLPFSPAITGLPHCGVPYFFVEQEYDTSRARSLLAAHGIECPSFAAYADAIITFVRKHPDI
ncbi:MAG: hypothetical protein C4325_11550 [Blastocatellia bacterium]